MLKSFVFSFIGFWAGSSSGRAPRLHRGGSGFKSCPVHPEQEQEARKGRIAQLVRAQH